MIMAATETMSQHAADLARFLIGPAVPIGEALAALENTSAGILLVADEDRHLLGTITDGDVRRGLLRGLTFEDTTGDVMHRAPIKVPEGMSRDQLIALMAANTIRHIPVVSEDGRVVDIALLSDLMKPEETGIAALIMAGGAGTRLRPLTESVPKPLLPVGDKPIIHHIIDLLEGAGIRDVLIATHYLADQFERELGDGSQWGVAIRYLREPRALGTGGALRLLEEAPSDPFLVMNGDLLTRLDLRAMLEHHRAHRAALTLAVREYQVQVPFGVVKVAPNHLVVDIEEKPLERYFVNAGIYLLGAAVLEMLPERDAMPMTDVIASVIDHGARVTAFPVVEQWIDVGRPADFERAQTFAPMVGSR
jgi:dTDP-glucose pyrophosphorylase/CBS domain-containing protein